MWLNPAREEKDREREPEKRSELSKYTSLSLIWCCGSLSSNYKLYNNQKKQPHDSIHPPLSLPQVLQQENLTFAPFLALRIHAFQTSHPRTWHGHGCKSSPGISLFSGRLKFSIELQLITSVFQDFDHLVGMYHQNLHNHSGFFLHQLFHAIFDSSRSLSRQGTGMRKVLTNEEIRWNSFRCSLRPIAQAVKGSSATFKGNIIGNMKLISIKNCPILQRVMPHDLLSSWERVLCHEAIALMALLMPISFASSGLRLQTHHLWLGNVSFWYHLNIPTWSAQGSAGFFEIFWSNLLTGDYRFMLLPPAFSLILPTWTSPCVQTKLCRIYNNDNVMCCISSCK